jgi:hypothetical protein
VNAWIAESDLTARLWPGCLFCVARIFCPTPLVQLVQQSVKIIDSLQWLQTVTKFHHTKFRGDGQNSLLCRFAIAPDHSSQLVTDTLSFPIAEPVAPKHILGENNSMDTNRDV